MLFVDILVFLRTHFWVMPLTTPDPNVRLSNPTGFAHAHAYLHLRPN